MKTRTIEFTAGELADLTSILDEALQSFEKDDALFEANQGQYKVILCLYHKLLK